MANDKKSTDRADESADIMPGRSLEGAEYGATEREQTRERERVVRGDMTDEAGEITDAEMEVREANGEVGGDRDARRQRDDADSRG